MNHSRTVCLVHGPGAPPDQASIVAWTTPFGGLKSLTGAWFVRSRTKACQSGAGPVREIGGSPLARGYEWSELPIQTPTATAGRLLSAGRARYPYVARSRVSLVVPVLTATGRRSPCGPFEISSTLLQIGFCDGSVLPERMSDVRKAACGDTTRVALGGAAS